MGEEIHDPTTDTTRVCSFTIAHTDEKDRLLWLNGGLLKNKAVNATEYWVPDALMIDGEWEKGHYRESWSCKKDGEVSSVDEETIDILEMSVVEAQRLDSKVLMFLRNLAPPDISTTRAS